MPIPLTIMHSKTTKTNAAVSTLILTNLKTERRGAVAHIKEEAFEITTSHCENHLQTFKHLVDKPPISKKTTSSIKQKHLSLPQKNRCPNLYLQLTGLGLRTWLRCASAMAKKVINNDIMESTWCRAKPLPALNHPTISPTGPPQTYKPTVSEGISFFVGFGKVWGTFPGYVGKFIEPLNYWLLNNICPQIGSSGRK